MKSSALLLVLVLGGACKSEASRPAPAAGSGPATAAGSATAEAITLPVPVPVVGERYTQDAEEVSNVTGPGPDGQQHTMEWKAISSSTRKVLAVADGKVTKLEVRYGVVRDDQTMDGKADGEERTISNRTFAVEVTAGGLEVSTGAAKPPLDSEEGMIREREGALLNQYALERVLATKTFRPGEAVVLTAADLAALNGPDEPYAMTAATFTLRSADASVAIFDTKLVYGKPGDPAVVSADLTGEMIVDRASGVVLSTTSAGPLSGKTTGTTSARTTIRRLPPE